MRVQCFGCGKWAKSEDCDLRRHRKSRIRRWFHKTEIKAGCLSGRFEEDDWEKVAPSLGESTNEEVMSIGNAMLRSEDNKN